MFFGFAILDGSLNDDVRMEITTPDSGYFVIDFIDIIPECLFSNVAEMIGEREIRATYEAEYFLPRAHTLKGEDAISDVSLFAVDVHNINFSLNDLISPSGSPAELLWGDVDNYCIHNIKIYFRVRGEGEIELSPENKESISSDTFKWVELPIAREGEFLTPFRREIFMRNLLVDALSLKLLPENLNLGRLISLSPSDLIHKNTKGSLSNETLIVLPEKYNPLWKLELVSKVSGRDLSNNFSVIPIPVDYVLQSFMVTRYPDSGVDLDQVEVRVYNSSEELPTKLALTSFLVITISSFMFVITIILTKRTKNGSSDSRIVGLESPSMYVVRELKLSDILGLHFAYNSLSHRSKYFFHPGFLGFESINFRWFLIQVALAASTFKLLRKLLLHICPFAVFLPIVATNQFSEIIGFAFIKVEGRISNIKVFFGRLGIYVRDDCQGKGVGSKLMKGLINFARKENVRKIHLMTLPSNIRAIRLYEKYGFKRTRTIKGGDVWYGKRLNCVEMSLDLHSS